MAQKSFNKVDQKKETPTQVFCCKFCEMFKNNNNCRFYLFIFSNENNVAKLAFDMRGNCFNRLCYRIENCNSFQKSLKKGIL